MIPTAVISFREFFEAFLIIGVFLGISKKLKLRREVEILLAFFLGLLLSLLMASITYLFGDFANKILSGDRAEIFESYLFIFSGFFIAYVIFSLHQTLRKKRGGKLILAHQKLQNNAFDISLFLTIVLIVAREGFEIALFTASTSLFSVFIQNISGLLLGLLAASILGVATYFSYLKFQIGKIFKWTEYMIMLLGAALAQNGITLFLKDVFHMNLSAILKLPLSFLPDSETFTGHLLQMLLGVDREFSLARLSIMAVYVAVIYFVFLRKKDLVVSKKTL